MSEIYADVKKRLYTKYESVARWYVEKTNNKVIQLNMSRIKPGDVAPLPPPDKGKIVFAVVNRTTWEGFTDAQRDLFNVAFDPQPFDFSRRVSLDGTQALFRTRVKTQAHIDKLDQWTSQGFLVAWYPYTHLEIDEDGNPTDTTIKEFLSGNSDWETPEV